MPKKKRASSASAPTHRAPRSRRIKSATLPDHVETIQVTFRIPWTWQTRADKIARALSSAGVDLTRTDGFRAAMAAGFEQLEGGKR